PEDPKPWRTSRTDRAHGRFLPIQDKDRFLPSTKRGLSKLQNGCLQAESPMLAVHACLAQISSQCMTVSHGSYVVRMPDNNSTIISSPELSPALKMVLTSKIRSICFSPADGIGLVHFGVECHAQPGAGWNRNHTVADFRQGGNKIAIPC